MSGYPTDEELELLISQLENQELYAPKHMKEQILNQAFPKQTVEIFPGAGSRGRSVQTFTYRLKIIAGMAAALIMLMIIPVQSEKQAYWNSENLYNREQRTQQVADREEQLWKDQNQTQEMSGTVNVNNTLNESMWKVNQKIDLWFERVNNLQIGNLFGMNHGGNYNEN